MKYVYDIILNFNDNYFEFYDWNKKDEITEIRKIPIFKVSNQVLYEIKNYTVQFDDLFISKIKNKTEYFSGRIIKLETAFLITDGLDVIAIKIGKKLKYSSLQINEELDILEDLNMIETSISYKKNAKNNMKRGLWQDLNAPCLTLTSHLAKVSMNSRDPILLVDADKELYRRFTPREAARIQSFPDTFKLHPSEAKSYKQIGNAIPPVMMWYIARNLIK